MPRSKQSTPNKAAKHRAVKVKYKNKPVHIPLAFDKAVDALLQVKPKPKSK